MMSGRGQLSKVCPGFTLRPPRVLITFMSSDTVQTSNASAPGVRSDGENLKWPAEVEDFDFIKDDNTDSSRVNCLGIHRVLVKRDCTWSVARSELSSNKVDVTVDSIPIMWLARYD